MIHGDIRPCNFLVDEYGILKLSDFKYTSFRKALEKTIKWFIDSYENHPETIRLYSKSKEKL